MIPQSLGVLSSWCGGSLIRGQESIIAQRVVTDTRLLGAGDLFVALRGDRFDGHAFLVRAAEAGAAAVLVAADFAGHLPEGTGVITVADTRKALGMVAARYRAQLAIPVVGVGGSCGKTSTKDILAAVVEQRWPTRRSPESFNNEIGVPITLLGVEPWHRVAVVELGSNHPGELAPLARMARPTHAIIASLGPEHLEHFGDMAGVVEEEGWLAELLSSSGTLFLYADDEGAASVAGRCTARVTRVGWGSGNDWQALDASVSAGGTTFRVAAPDPAWSGEYRVALSGRHQVCNAILAIAAAAELGMKRSEVEQGLARCVPAKHRMRVVDVGGTLILDDCYNANPASMRAGLDTLVELGRDRRTVAVLGDMAELGEHALAAHREAGTQAGRCGVDVVLCVGSMAGTTAAAAREAGVPLVEVAGSVEEAVEVLTHGVRSGDCVLIKASRSSRFERLVDALQRRFTPAAAGVAA